MAERYLSPFAPHPSPLAPYAFIKGTPLNVSILQAATQLLDQRLSLTPITDLPEPMRPRDESHGYQLQRVLNGLLTVAGMGEQAGQRSAAPLR